MGGIWITSENRERAMELLNIGRNLADKMGTEVSLFLSQDRERAQDYIECGADEIFLLPPLAEDQSLDAYSPHRRRTKTRQS